MKKIISLCIGFALLISVAMLIFPWNGITYGKGKGQNATIQSEEELIALMNSAVKLFSDIKGNNTASSVENEISDNSTFSPNYTNLPVKKAKASQDGNSYDSMTIHQELYINSRVSVGELYTDGSLGDSKSYSSVFMEGDAFYYITNSAVLIKLDVDVKYREAAETTIHLIGNYYIDKNNVYLMIERYDTSVGISALDSILNKWIDVYSTSSSVLDELASMMQQLTLDVIPETIQCTRNYFSENKDEAFNKTNNIYEIKSNYFADFYKELMKINSGTLGYIIDIPDTDAFDRLSGNYIFDLSDKESPAFTQDVSASYTYQNYSCTSESTTKLTFENINNTVLEPPTKIWDFDELMGGAF